MFFCLGLLYWLKHPFLDVERISKVSDVLYIKSAIALSEEPYLYLKPPQESVHYIPKWFPTQSCIEEVLRFVNFAVVTNLQDPTSGQTSFVAKR